MNTELVGRDIIKKESIAYIGNNVLRKISYVQLYNYLTDARKLTLLANNDVYKTDNINLLNVLDEISGFNRKEYDDIPKKYSLQFAHTQEKIDKVNEAVETERIRFKNTEYDVHESVYKEFENEERLKKSETDARLSLSIAKTAFIIALAALIIISFQVVLHLTENKTSGFSPFETKIIKQNDSIIHLLKQQKMQDTTIVNFITPEILRDSITE
jgi:hypothetical protein